MSSYMNFVVRIVWRDTFWYTLNHKFFSWIHIWIYDFSWNHTWALIWNLLRESSIILEIMCEEYREESSEEYSELMGIFGEFRILYCEFLHACSPARGRAISGGSHPCCRCAWATCLIVSRSIRQNQSAKTP